MAGPTVFKLMFIFDTEAEAQAAADLCNTGLSARLSADKATAWAIPQQRVTDGKWFFMKPIGPRYNCGVCSKVPKCVYTTKRIDASWTAGSN